MASELRDPRYQKLIGLLIDARKAKGLTQRDLAALANCKQQFIGRYETCDRAIGIFDLIDISALLDVDGLELARQAAASGDERDLES